MPSVLGPIRAVNTEKVATTDATVTTIATIPIPDDSSVLVDVWVEVFRTNSADQGVFRRRAGVFRRAAGAAALEGSVDTPLTRKSVSSPTWEVTIDVDGGNNARVRVTGAVGHNLNWTCQFTVSIGE